MRFVLALAVMPALLLAGVCYAPAVVTGAGGQQWANDACVSCHKRVSPGIVTDWSLSRHYKMNISCQVCHGSDHKTMTDYAKAKIPTADVCGKCHMGQVNQFKKGKHALAWAAMKAMPTFHFQPMAMTEGMKGCGGCHKIGLKTEEEIRELKQQTNGFGVASCDACHTRHTFSKKEAQQPQACQTCHMGFDHPQYEMYSSSKHGVRNELKQKGILPASASAPTCQSCHMPEGHHGVETGWGFLAVRLPMPEDKQWAADRAVILQALGVLDPDGKPTPRLDVVKAARVARLDEAEFQKHRDNMQKQCSKCHSGNFARNQLEQGDKMIREADRLMAEAITIVAKLYKEGVIPKPKNYAYAFPDLLTFHDAPTVIEQKLFVMFFEHRMRTFQGTFHSNPDYALWYGWSEMQRSLAEIKELDKQMRREHAKS